MKNLLNLKGVKTLSKDQQTAIHGGGRCKVGCAGKPNGAHCYGAPNCDCPGMCAGGSCNIW